MFYYNCQIHFTSNSGIRNTFYIYLYIYLNACHFQCLGYTLAKGKITPPPNKQKGKHDTQGREEEEGLQIHPTNQIQRTPPPPKPTKPQQKTFGHYLQTAKEKVPTKAGKALAENGSH